MQQDHFVQKPPCNTTVWVYNNRLCNCDIFRPGNCAPSPPLSLPILPKLPTITCFSASRGGGWYWEKLGIFSVLGIQVKILSSKSDLPIENKLNGDCHIWRETIPSVTQIRNTGDEREDGVRGVWGVCTLLRTAGQAPPLNVRRPPLNWYFSLTSSLINWRRVG